METAALFEFVGQRDLQDGADIALQVKSLPVQHCDTWSHWAHLQGYQDFIILYQTA